LSEGKLSLVIFELDVSFCAKRYGETNGAGTCPAVLGMSSLTKCYNSIATCPVKLSYADETVTLRFTKSVAYRPKGLDCIPSLVSASISPGTIKPGESLGERSTLSVTLRDHPHPDTGGRYDKYRSERDYDPVDQGTYWGKLRARQPYLPSRKCRLILGHVEDGVFIEEERRTFFVESFEGPTLAGTFTIEAKDAFKFLDGDRAMAPEMSNGFLLADVSATATSFTLSPSGIGNAEYATSGLLAIGGKEIVAFTRSNDVITIAGGLAGRAQKNTAAVAHKAQDRVQTVLSFFGEDVADILQTLMVDYAEVPADYIPIDDWHTETEGFLGTVYTADIAEPTPVKTLCDELIEQAALCVWPDDVAEKIRLTVLRAIPTDAKLFDEHNRVKDAPLGINEQTDKRLSQVWTRYAQINPLKAIDDDDNFRSQQVTVDLEAETLNGSSAIKVINSRWIPQNARAVAQKLNNKLLARYRTAPRLFDVAVMRYTESDPELGRGCNIGSHLFQDASGGRVNVPAQVIRLSPMQDRLLAQAEEMRFDPLPGEDIPHLVIIDSDSFNIDLRALHDSQYPEAESGDTVTFVINEGVTVGSKLASVPALLIDNGWAAGVSIVGIIRGRIQGKGGKGGDSYGALNGEAGGTALYTRWPISLDVASGQILGGGGGGAALFTYFGGGGGAGQDPGLGGYGNSPAQAGSPGTNTTGGAGGFTGGTGRGGAGGGIGQPGTDEVPNTSSTPGAAGKAIDGVSYITVTAGPGDIRGPQVN